VRVFDAMATQWDRAGERGVKVGLKYSRAPLFMRMLECRAAKRQQVFDDLRVLELETLEVDGEQREAARERPRPLVAAVALDAAEFVQGAEKAKFTAAQLATDVDKQMRGIENSVKGALGGIAAGSRPGFGISALKSAFDAYAEGAAKLGDLAAKAGTTVEIMGGLGAVAKLSKTSMDDVAGAMAKLAQAAR
jgi:hypothetical protein